MTMAEDNESQGLKIAVAAFISLTVVLGVASYFLYSNFAMAQARLDSARDGEQRAKRAAALALTQYDEMRTRIGTKAEECDAAKEEISANFKKVEERLNNLINVVNVALKTAEQNGVQGQDLEDINVEVQKAIASYRNEPNRTYISSLERLTDAMENLARLTSELSVKYSAVKRNVERGAGGNSRK